MKQHYTFIACVDGVLHGLGYVFFHVGVISSAPFTSAASVYCLHFIVDYPVFLKLRSDDKIVLYCFIISCYCIDMAKILDTIKSIAYSINNFLNSHLVIKIIFLSFPCFYIDNYKSLGPAHDFIFYYLLWISSTYVLIDYFVIKKKKITKIMFAFLIYYFWVIIRQLIAGLTLNDLHLSISACTIVFIIETYIKDNPHELLQSFLYIFELYIYINAISIVYRYMFLNSKKIENLFLVNNRNVFVPYALAAIVLGVIYTKNTGNKKRGSILCLISLCSMLIIKSATAIVCGVFLVAYFFLVFLYSKKGKKLEYTFFQVAILAIVINLLLFLYAYNVDDLTVFGNLPYLFFHKSPHLTNRTDIWIESIKMIKEKFIFGYGDEVEIHYYRNTASKIREFVQLQPHNAVLRILMQFGLIGLSLFSYFSFGYIRYIDRKKYSIYKYLIVGVFFSLFIYCAVEVCGIFYLFYIMVFLSCHLDDIQND